MKILQLCHKVPYPPKDGGCIAINNLTQGLINEGNTVKVLAINTPKHFTNISDLPQEYKNKTNIEAVYADTRIKLFSALVNLFSRNSYNIVRFHSKPFKQKLIALFQTENYDVVQLESLYMCNYIETIRSHSKAKIVLRSHNVEHQIWERNAGLTKHIFKKWYLKLLAKRLKNYELETLEKIDALACITKKDENYFKKQGFNRSMDTFPFGIDLQQINSNTHSTQPYSLFHIGSMDWLPNQEGIKWFLQNIWPIVVLKHPELRLYLAGRNMPEWLKNLRTKNVIVEGEVNDAHAFMRSKNIMIVPLLSGGGMRVKIIEGMALGKTIISTSVGAEGISYTDKVNILIADDTNNFAEAISRCILDMDFTSYLGSNAKMMALRDYDNAGICKRLVDFYRKLTLND